jgi:hypothetical protein
MLAECERAGGPATLMVSDNISAQKAQRIVAELAARGWRVAVDNVGELWFWPPLPEPLRPPDDATRRMN